MTFISCPDRERILAATGHVVVTGGPGCGKTTVAIRKAMQRIESGLQPGQKVLFLSFSRAAVARITQSARKDLPRELRAHLEIQTFHSFCWQVVRGHGYLLGAPDPIRLLAPHDERARRNGAKDDDPRWFAEREHLFLNDGLLVFDLFAPMALRLLKGSDALRQLLAARYPLIIVDEAQDTGTEQWACIEALADLTQLLCLADLDQQIYDFRTDVSPERLKQILDTLEPVAVSLGGQNNRSPGVEIVKFGNDILAGTPRGSPYEGVSQYSFRPDAAIRDSKIRAAVGILRTRIEQATGRSPESIGFLTNWGKGVAIIARALQGGEDINEIPHRVVMDEVDVLLATRVVAFLLEPVNDVYVSLAIGLELIAELYRARGKADNVRRLMSSSADARSGRLRGNAKCPRTLKAVLEQLQQKPLVGQPTKDWLTIRRMLDTSDTEELKKVARLVIYLMGFNRGRRISDALAEAWQRCGEYAGARALIEAAITEDQIVCRFRRRRPSVTG